MRNMKGKRIIAFLLAMFMVLPFFGSVVEAIEEEDAIAPFEEAIEAEEVVEDEDAEIKDEIEELDSHSKDAKDTSEEEIEEVEEEVAADEGAETKDKTDEVVEDEATEEVVENEVKDDKNEDINHENFNKKKNKTLTFNLQKNSNGNQIIKNLEIINKANEYYPGESIYIKGDWSIPNDQPGHQYKAGDKFSMTIPEGLKAGFNSIDLGIYATGKIEGNNLVFTFNEEIEGLINREGGFNLRFEIKSTEEEGKSEVDITSKDENGNILLSDKIVVNKPKQGEIGPSDETFGKGAFLEQTVDGLKWYVRINHNNAITGSKIKFEDRLGEDHLLKEETIKVEKHITDPTDSTDITDDLKIIIDSDKKGFTISDLELGNEPGGHKHYTIYYETEYIGEKTEGIVSLENTAKLVTENQGVLYPEHGDEKGVVIGDFNLTSAGWGIGEKWVKFKLKKVDSVTKKPLSGARFKLSHKIDKNFTPIYFETDENGEYTHNEYINNGLYVLEEILAPEGYKKMEPKDIRILWDSSMVDAQVFEFEVENELEPISISGKKIWTNEDNEQIVAKDDIIIGLFAKEEKIRQIILPKGQSEFEFKKLNKVDEKGKDIEYSIKELDSEGNPIDDKGEFTLGQNKYIVNYNENSNKETIITNKYVEPEKTSVQVTKSWEDNNDQDGIRPESVTIKLIADGKETDKSLILNEENNWTGTFSELDEYKEGKKIEYTVEEEEVKGYTNEISGTASEGFIVTNTHEVEKVDISGSKTWKDNNNQDGKRPETITVNLLKNGIKLDSKTVSEKDDWSWTFKDLDKFEDGQEIVYTITEDKVENYTTEINEYDITNSYTPGKTSVQVTKTWDDENDYDRIRPDTITIKLLADGKVTDKKLVLSEDNDWSDAFTNLDEYKNGEKIIYTVEEVEVEGYKTIINGDADEGFSIINKHDPETVEVSVTKKWVGTQEDSVTINLLANGEKVDSVELTEEDNWTHTFTDLRKLDDEGKEIVYTVSEVEIEGYMVEITGDMDTGFIVKNTRKPIIPQTPTKPTEPTKPVDPKPVEPKPVIPSTPNKPEPVKPMPVIPSTPNKPQAVKPIIPQTSAAPKTGDLGIATSLMFMITSGMALLGMKKKED